jgi:hypothetical protein
MNCPDAPMIMRLDCAKNAASLMYEKPRGKVVVIGYERPSSLAAAIPANPAGRRGMTPRALDGASAQHTGNRHDGQHHTIVVVAIPRKRGWRMPRPRAPSGSNPTLGTGQARSQKGGFLPSQRVPGNGLDVQADIASGGGYVEVGWGNRPVAPVLKPVAFNA